MNRGLNKVQIIGNVGRDPEMRYTPTGCPVTTFSIGVARSWSSSDGGKHSEIEWFNIVAWRNLAEICKQNLFKNRLVYIEGRLQTRQWEDHEGNKRSSVEIVANEMILLDVQHDDKETSFDSDQSNNMNN